ncbi:Glycosyltransferase involved in cell wall bisynthesis [Halorientalis persicus]|uniref:Glycosyltransferase involved in cell wall bisynthesis n=1 Tax=Halorientalis persicus TaxID=1367881 RepID=A0A1H8ET05_9EURY|nr:glycosyltransferase family 4 protein [Halorientalis persicus]SEN22615.1 Glycosyltransferase involved in cell wall bisynthesis [Halorientalis persicus]
MRVAFVSERTVFHESTEGRERLHRIATNLDARGHDVTVYCAQWWPDYPETIEHEGITYRGITVSDSKAAFLARIPWTVALDRPDVIHATPEPPGVVTAAKLAAVPARAPLVVEWFGDEDLPDSRARSYAARLPDTVVTPSELVRTTVREYGATGDNTRVIPESIDTELIDEVEPDEDADIVYARELDADANVQTLLLALAELRQRDWSATIIGDGPRREEIERQAEDLRIDDRITFAGDLDREERISIYRGAHTFVHTAFRENFATELLWALACGCIGIVEYQAESSAHELIETYRRSFRVTDDEELTEAIRDAAGMERLDRDPDMDRYDHEEVLDRYLDCYRDLREEQGLF